MATVKKADGEKKCLQVYFSIATHRRLIAIQGQYQVKHGKRIHIDDLAGKVLDAVVDRYVLE
jgi:hypothetical protein